MRSILVIIICFLSLSVYSQKIQPRANGIVTVLDSNLFTGKSFRVPVFSDTISANLYTSLDSSGKIIYTYDVNYLWYRTSLHGWAAIGSNAPASDSIFFTYPLVVNGSTVYMNPASLIISGYLDSLDFAKFYFKQDSVVLIGNNLYGYTNGIETFIASLGNGFFSNAGLISTGGITLVDSTVTVLADIVWQCDEGPPVTYVGDFSTIIPAAAPDYYRVDLIYIDCGTGGIDTAKGQPDTIFALPPALPDGAILISEINVFGNVITVPNVVSTYQKTAVTFIDSATGNITTDSAWLNYQKGVKSLNVTNETVKGNITMLNSNSQIRFVDGNNTIGKRQQYMQFSGDGGNFMWSISGTPFAYVSKQAEFMRWEINQTTLGGFVSGARSATLELNDVSRAFLPNRGTNVQMNAIPLPAPGMLYWNTTDSTLYQYRGFSGWSALGGGGGSVTLQDAFNASVAAGNIPKIDAGTDSLSFNFTPSSPFSDVFTSTATNGVISSAINQSAGQLTFASQNATDISRVAVISGVASLSSQGTSDTSAVDANIDSVIIKSPLIAFYKHGDTANTSVVIGGKAAVPSAIVNIPSTTKGLLIPRMTTSERNLISSPATSLLIYNNTLDSFQYYQGSTWHTLGGGSGGSGVTTMAAIGAVPNGNGASISGSTLTLQPASGSFGGVLTNSTQTIAGTKTFSNMIIARDNSTDNGLNLTGTITANNSFHGYADHSVYSMNRTNAAASFDAQASIDGNLYYDHNAAFQARNNLTSGDSLDRFMGFVSIPVNAGVVQSLIGYRASDPSGGGVTNNNYGVYIDSLSASNNAYSIWTAKADIMHKGIPTATANRGFTSIGSGTWAGAAGDYQSSATGSVLAVNSSTSFTGILAGLQKGGRNKFLFDAAGLMGINCPITTMVSKINVFDSAASTSSSARFGNGSISLANGLDVGINTSNQYCVTGKAAGVLVIGTNNTARLTFDGTSTATFSTGVRMPYAAKTGTYTVTVNDYNINCTANTFTVTLLSAVGIAGETYNIVNSGSGTITIATTSSQTFTNITSTPTTLTLSPVGAAAIVSYSLTSDGANWIVTGKVKNE